MKGWSFLILILSFIILNCSNKCNSNQRPQYHDCVYKINNSTQDTLWIWWSRENTLLSDDSEKAISYFLDRGKGDYNVFDLLVGIDELNNRRQIPYRFFYKRIKPGEDFFLVLRGSREEKTLEECIEAHLVVMDTVTLFNSHRCLSLLEGNDLSYQFDTIIIDISRPMPGYMFSH